MGFKQERRQSHGIFEVIVDLNELTNERRVAVYHGETMLAIEYVPNMNERINRLLSVAAERSKQFPATRD